MQIKSVRRIKRKNSKQETEKVDDHADDDEGLG